MTITADIERILAAVRKALPAISDEAVERVRSELARSQLPRWSWAASSARWSLADRDDVYAEARESGDRHRWDAWTATGKEYGYATTLNEAMRAAERALGLPECEVVT